MAKSKNVFKVQSFLLFFILRLFGVLAPLAY